jgi:hypothetical protein
MPRSPRAEVPYDPIRADLVREVTGAPRPSAVQPPPPAIPRFPPATLVESALEPTITKRFVLTRGEDAEVGAFLLRLQNASGCKVPLSVIVRAALANLMEREEAIVRSVSIARPQLPSTHDRLALGQFEEQWRQVITSTF